MSDHEDFVHTMASNFGMAEASMGRELYTAMVGQTEKTAAYLRGKGEFLLSVAGVVRVCTLWLFITLIPVQVALWKWVLAL